MVLSSKDFLTSAQNAHGFIAADNGKVKELTGAIWVISLAVVCGWPKDLLLLSR